MFFPDSESKPADTSAESSIHNSQLPSLSLPKGGGAIRGIGEKFTVAATGTASFSIPVSTSPGRSHFSPSLILSYDSGAGASPYGLGWNLPIPFISRKTEKKLPRYFDSPSDHADSDVFILAGAEDLVPVLTETAGVAKHEAIKKTLQGEGDYFISRYRPRIESLFSRIEKWTKVSNGEIHWRTMNRENAVNIFGKSPEARVADPSRPERIFKWLLEESRDDKGNIIRYEYKRENQQGIKPLISEQTRLDAAFSNLYPKRVLYGNTAPFKPEGWLFEAVFDYGDHDDEIPVPQEDRPWLCRKDPFSTFNAGFEIRTYRLCRRVLMFHHFKELGPGPCLVKALSLEYREGEVFSFLSAAAQISYRKKKAGPGYFKKAMPKLEFTYTEPRTDSSLHWIEAGDAENLPSGVEEKKYIWTDLEKEGLSGVLSETAGAWFYKHNLGNAKFGAARLVAEKPSAVTAQGAQLTDLAADSGQYLAVRSGSLRGFYRMNEEGKWEAFTPFESDAREAEAAREKIFLDLDGDGAAEVFLDEDSLYSWYPSLGEKGYGPKEYAAKPADASRRPELLRSSPSESILAADMSGDGLQDIVRIRNGEVCYWPNLGWGLFGRMITTADAPWFDHAEQFDARRIRLADIDGSGISDLIYLGRNESRYWFNLSGNGWSEARTLEGFPDADNHAQVSALDLLGNGTSCLVWNSALPGARERNLRYLDLMGGVKPHLLETTKNNLGAESKIEYAPSTRFYLEDREAGNPWITKLPFPVHVVSRVETFDLVSRSRFVTRYAYHHGYYDHAEREFRGFGLVDQTDTEEFEIFSASMPDEDLSRLNIASHVPPALTRTWYHTGAYIPGEKISQGLARDYYSGDSNSLWLPDTVLPSGLNAEEEREACRALKGNILRQEIYALDRSEKESLPFSVSERNYSIRCLQGRGNNRHAVFSTHARERVDLSYERKLFEIGGKNLPDPRVSHALTLETDDFGNELLSAAIAYGRRFDDPSLSPEDRADQKRTLITAAESRYTNAIDEENNYRTPLLFETRTYEFRNLISSGAEMGVTPLFSFEVLRSAIKSAAGGANDIPYEDLQAQTAKSGMPSRRLIEHVRTIYRRNDLSGPLPLGELQSLALPFETLKLAFTPGLITSVYGDRVNDAMLSTDGGYVHSAGDSSWWSSSGRFFYSPELSDTPAAELAFARAHFFLSRRFADSFGNTTVMRYDEYDLLLLETEDALGNKTTAGERLGADITSRIDYRVLQPWLVTDPNSNRTAAAFDILGLVAGTAVMGKEGETKGDSLEGFEPDLDDNALAAYFENPLSHSHALLQKATTRMVYDLYAFSRTQTEHSPAPCFVSTISRETHAADLSPDQTGRLYHLFSYSDGFGREIQLKEQAEGGLLNGGAQSADPRWTGSGWMIFNNKGLQVKKFEPFFSAVHKFEFARTAGVSATLFYDPLGRSIATLHPDHAYEKIVFGPWSEERWDKHDTLLFSDPKLDPDAGDYFRRLNDGDYLPSWLARRAGGALGIDEKNAALNAVKHALTPSFIYLDPLGRPFLTLADNGAAGKEKSKFILDIEGNRRAAMDAMGRTVMRFDYSIAGAQISQAGMDAGARWALLDISGRKIYTWNSRGHRLRVVYDALRRPVQNFLSENEGNEKLIQRITYGEAEGETFNHRGRVLESFDGAGKFSYHAYDFKGNVVSSSRQFAVDYKNTLDWSKNIVLEPHLFTDTMTYDALNRPVEIIPADSSVIRPFYNESRKLERIEARLRGAEQATPFIVNIDYDAKGRRTFIQYANGVRTFYEYDPETFRLIGVRTTRGNTPLQDLIFTYEPLGNLSSVRDEAQEDIYFNGAVAEASGEYTYDALYRLISASGREHAGRQDHPECDWDDEFRSRLPHPHDAQAMRRYSEKYEYDGAGNILRLIHQAQNGNWSRNYFYEESSRLESGKNNNCLSRTGLGRGGDPPIAENYAYDAHGNITATAHLPSMKWNYLDLLQSSARQSVSDGVLPETTYYLYDASGRRVRKVTERSNGTRKEERFYAGAVEVFRSYDSAGTRADLERETLHIFDGDKRIAVVETKVIDTRSSQDIGIPCIRYQFDNQLGSACLELDASGAVITYEEYYPFGGTSFQAGRSAAEVSLKRYRFTGKERDEETGFTYHGARYYAPWLGRWISADPAGIEDGLNVYAYVKNNPLVLHDPTGTKNEPKNETDKQIMMMTDPQLFNHLKGLSKTARNDFASSATGAFQNRAWAMLNKYHMEREVQLKEVTIEGKVAKNLKEYWDINKGRMNKTMLRQEWDEDHPIDPKEEFNDDRVAEILEEALIETWDTHPGVTHGNLAETALHDVIMPRRGNNQNLDAPLNLNFAAADHFLYAIEMSHDVGWVGARIQIAGYDEFKQYVPSTGKQSAPDERVKDWAFKGTDEAIDWGGRNFMNICEPGDTDLDPGDKNRVQVIQQERKAREDLQSQVRLMGVGLGD